MVGGPHRVEVFHRLFALGHHRAVLFPKGFVELGAARALLHFLELGAHVLPALFERGALFGVIWSNILRICVTCSSKPARCLASTSSALGTGGNGSGPLASRWSA